GSDADAANVAELSVAAPRAADREQALVLARHTREKNLHAVVAGIGNVQVAVGGHGHALGKVELPWGASIRSPRGHEYTGGRETLDAVVIHVGHVHVSTGIDVDGTGIV